MSDFLGRLAARASGGGAVAQPRVPGLFEDAAASELAVEVVDEVVSRLGPTELALVPPAPAEPPAAAVPGVEPASPAQPRGAAGAPPDDAEHPAPHADVAPAPPVAEPVRTTELPPPAAVVAALPLPSAVPALVGAPEPAAPEPSHERQDEPAVRVHIGRLEVRANLEGQAARQPARREPAARDELSLADYLRGRRETA